MSFANPISCGRDQHRHPPRRQLADHVEHLCDELRIERARDLVQQHDVGLHRQRANDRDALLLPARQAIGILVRLVRQPEPVEQLPRALLSLVRGEPSTFLGASVTFRSTVMCGNRLNDWKTMPIWRRTAFVSTPAAVMSRPCTTIRPSSSGSSRLMHRRSVDFPEPGGADQADDLVVGDLEVDPAQDLELAEPLVHAVDPDGLAHTIAPACRFSRWRATTQSVKRVSGIVITRKHNATPTIGVKLKSAAW